MARLLLVLAGILALASLLFTWWFSYYSTTSFQSLNPMVSLLGNSSKLIYNISPIEEAGSPGVPINYTTFGRNYYRYSFVVPISIILIVAAAFLCIVGGLLGSKSNLYDGIPGIMVFASIAMFVFLLVYTGGINLLAGSLRIFSTTAFWGLGPGIFIALVAAILMLYSRMSRKNLCMH